MNAASVLDRLGEVIAPSFFQCRIFLSVPGHCVGYQPCPFERSVPWLISKFYRATSSRPHPNGYKSVCPDREVLMVTSPWQRALMFIVAGDAGPSYTQSGTSDLRHAGSDPSHGCDRATGDTSRCQAGGSKVGVLVIDDSRQGIGCVLPYMTLPYTLAPRAPGVCRGWRRLRRRRLPSGRLSTSNRPGARRGKAEFGLLKQPCAG